MVPENTENANRVRFLMHLMMKASAWLHTTHCHMLHIVAHIATAKYSVDRATREFVPMFVIKTKNTLIADVKELRRLVNTTPFPPQNHQKN